MTRTLTPIGFLCLALLGCTESATPDAGSGTCGPQGAAVVVDNHPFCIYPQSVVIETGFSCPEGMAPQGSSGGLAACGVPGVDPSLTAQAIGIAAPSLPGLAAPAGPVVPPPSSTLADAGDPDAGATDTDPGDTAAAVDTTPDAEPQTPDAAPACTAESGCDDDFVCQDGECVPKPEDNGSGESTPTDESAGDQEPAATDPAATEAQRGATPSDTSETPPAAGSVAAGDPCIEDNECVDGCACEEGICVVAD